MSVLFVDHEDLLQGFNAFLPEDHQMPPPRQVHKEEPKHERRLSSGSTGGYPFHDGRGGSSFGGGVGNTPALNFGRIDLPGAQSQQREGDVNYAVNFVAKVKKRFSRQPEKYARFLEVLHEYEEAQMSPDFLMHTVSKLFADHPDLLKELTFFLPPQVQSDVSQHERMAMGGGGSYFGGGGAAGGAAPQTEPDMTLAVSFLNKVHQRFAHEREKYQYFLELLHEYERGQVAPEQVMATVNTLLADHPDLVRDFTYFLPDAKPKTELAAPPQSNQKDMNFAFHFVNKVKDRFANEPEKYTLFLNTLQEYEKSANWPNALEVAQNLFANHPDLLRDFAFFLPKQPSDPSGKARSEEEKKSSLLPLSRPSAEPTDTYDALIRAAQQQKKPSVPSTSSLKSTLGGSADGASVEDRLKARKGSPSHSPPQGPAFEPSSGRAVGSKAPAAPPDHGAKKRKLEVKPGPEEGSLAASSQPANTLSNDPNLPKKGGDVEVQKAPPKALPSSDPDAMDIDIPSREASKTLVDIARTAMDIAKRPDDIRNAPDAARKPTETGKGPMDMLKAAMDIASKMEVAKSLTNVARFAVEDAKKSDKGPIDVPKPPADVAKKLADPPKVPAAEAKPISKPPADVAKRPTDPPKPPAADAKPIAKPPGDPAKKPSDPAKSSAADAKPALEPVKAAVDYGKLPATILKEPTAVKTPADVAKKTLDEGKVSDMAKTSALADLAKKALEAPKKHVEVAKAPVAVPTPKAPADAPKVHAPAEAVKTRAPENVPKKVAEIPTVKKLAEAPMEIDKKNGKADSSNIAKEGSVEALASKKPAEVSLPPK